MQPSIRRRAFLGACTLGLAGLAASAHAAWPERSVRVIVPFPAGGINDTVGRLVFNQMANHLGASIVVENRPGAGGTIGTMAAVNSDPDGYTLLLGAASTIAVAPNLYAKAGYRPEKDLIAVGAIGGVPSVAVVAANKPWQNLQALLDDERKQSGTLNYGSAGAGTSHHVQTELLKLRTNTQFQHVPYKGGAPAMTDLIGNQIDLMLEPLPTALPHIQANRVRALGVTSKARSAQLPDVPTFQEAGVADYDASTWFGLFAPAGVAADRIDILANALAKALAEPALQKEFASRGIDTMPLSRAEFADFVRKEDGIWVDVIRQANLRVD